MTSTATAQPAPAIASVQEDSVARSALCAPPTNASTVTVAPGYNAITVELRQIEKPDKTWYADSSFWAAIVPAVALLVTIWNTNKQLRAGREALDRQLAEAKATSNRQIEAEHERQRLDRITKARQEIYAEILADYQKVQALLGGLADGDPNEPINFSVIAAMSAGINKLWVWGEIESAYQAREFYSQVNELAWSARGRAEAIRRLKRKFEDIKALLDSSSLDRERVAKEISEHEASVEFLHQEEAWTERNTALTKELRDHEANRNAASDMTLRIAMRIAERRNDYTQFLIEEQARLMIQVNNVMALARGDVGLYGDVSRLEQQSHDMSERARAAVENMQRVFDDEMKKADLA